MGIIIKTYGMLWLDDHQQTKVVTPLFCLGISVTLSIYGDKYIFGTFHNSYCCRISHRDVFSVFAKFQIALLTTVTVINRFYPNVTTLRSGLCYRNSVCRLSVTLVHSTQGVAAFGNISSPLCTLAILWPPCKILRRSSEGNPSVGSVKRNRGIKIERFWTYRRLHLINGTRYRYSLY